MNTNRIITVLFAGLIAGCMTLSRAGTNDAAPDVRRDATVEAVERAMPCVVNIATATPVERNDDYYRMMRSFYGNRIQREFIGEEPYASGSGVIIDEDGYLISNIHVIQGASRIQVKLSDGRVYEAQSLVGLPNSDVVLLRIRAKPGEKFQAIKLAKDDDLLLGETVIAIGNPYGLEGSVSRGILSSKSRRQPDPNRELSFENWLQTDAAINPGNSGGALINLRGELIGVNVAVYRDADRDSRGMGVGFAIPVKQISTAITEFFTPEDLPLDGVASLWFGAKFKAAPNPLTIAEVRAGSPAEKAGLKPGQLVLEINGKRPKSPMDCAETLLSTPKRLAVFTVAEGFKRSEVKVQMEAFEELFEKRLGLNLGKLSVVEVERLGLKPGDGVMTGPAESGGPADKAGLRPGMLLVRFDDKPALDLSAAAAVLSEKKPGDTLRLTGREIGRNVFGAIVWRQFTVGVKVR